MCVEVVKSAALACVRRSGLGYVSEKLQTIGRFRRKHRRIATGWLNQHAVDEYTHVLDHEAIELVWDLFVASKEGKVPVNPQVCLLFFINN